MERRLFLSAAYFISNRPVDTLSAWPSDPLLPPCQGMEDPRCYLEAGFKSPGLAMELSLLPGLGILYVDEPVIAVGQFVLSVVFSTLMAYSAWTVINRAQQKSKWHLRRDLGLVASMGFVLIGTFFLQRYYLGGMREAARLANVKNLQKDRETVLTHSSD